jgi:hypothetical protein
LGVLLFLDFAFGDGEKRRGIVSLDCFISTIIKLRSNQAILLNKVIKRFSLEYKKF